MHISHVRASPLHVCNNEHFVPAMHMMSYCRVPQPAPLLAPARGLSLVLQAAASEISDPGSAQVQPEVSGGGGGAGWGWRSRGARQEASSDVPRGQSQQGSHPNRWMELADGWAIKTVYKSTLAHQQCPIAGGCAEGKAWQGRGC